MSKKLLIFFCLFFIGCKTTESLKNKKGNYLETVQINFNAGEQAFAQKDYDKAMEYFQFVKSNYYFSEYASLSDLRIADAKFAQEKWLEAALAYEIFIRLHPRHKEVNQAYYKVGISYFNAIPKDNFFLPKAITKDQTATYKAIEAFELFLQLGLNNPWTDDVNNKIIQAKTYIADHEKDIADFYKKVSNYEAAAKQYEEVATKYPLAIKEAECLYQAAVIYEKKLKDPAKAQDIYKSLLNYEQNYYTELAIKALERMNNNNKEN